MLTLSLGSRIRELRNQKKLTQEELGKILGVSKVSVSGYENDTRQPDNKALLTLSNTFGVTTDYLLGQNNTPQWANQRDTNDLKSFLDNDSGMTYGGENLTEEENAQLRVALTQIFWKRRKVERKSARNVKEE